MQPLHVRPPTVSPPPRFPLRTLVLMVLALAASLHFLWRTHRPVPTRAHVVSPEVWLKGRGNP
ncbi:MAG: hypothetical protein ACLQDQ_20220 [Myxococcaceae bacterium]